MFAQIRESNSCSRSVASFNRSNDLAPSLNLNLRANSDAYHHLLTLRFAAFLRSGFSFPSPFR